MKKILLSAAMMVAAVSFANAQWFVGGNVGVNSTSGDLYGDETTTNFSIMPKVGYIFNENWAAGVQLGYASISDVSSLDFHGLNGTGEAQGLAARAFARYTPWQLGRFSLAFEGGLAYESLDLKDEDVKFNNFGLYIVPVVQFDLTCNVMLESRFNFAALNADFTSVKPDGGDSVNGTSVGFGVNADGADLTGGIELGFIVKF